jgi:hypothetical protein
MNEHSGKLLPHIEVDPALREHATILANLLELYAHDFSEFHSLDLGPDGRFGYKSLSLYWSEPNRHPFLIRVGGKLAGLALVKRGSGFLVMRRSGTCQNSLFSADAEDVELECLQQRRCGGVFRGLGKFVSCNRMSWRTYFGSRRSLALLVRRSNLFALRKVVGIGNFSHFNRSSALATPV